MTDTVAEAAPQSQVTVLTGRRWPWARIGITALVIVVLAAIAAAYYKRAPEPLMDRAALDAAQVARNIANGRGFVTNIVRPFNVTLKEGDLKSLPELNNGPLYPYVLSAVFKLKTPCDQVVQWVSLAFLVLTVLATLAMGSVLFDWKTGLVAAAVVGLSGSVLHQAVSGMGLTMAAFEFTMLLIGVALHHRASVEQKSRTSIILAGLCGAVAAALYMTNYVNAFAVVPAAVYFAITGNFRKRSLVAFLVVATALMAPCAYRNLEHTGFPVLGVRAWDVMANTDKYPGDNLVRSTEPARRGALVPLMFPFEYFRSFARKLVAGFSNILGALPSFLGLAALSLTVVSMLYRFRKPSANAVRGLMYVMVPVMIAVFSLYSESRDSVILFVPTMAVFAAAYLILLIDSKKLHPFFGRAIIGGFLAITAMHSVEPLFWGPGKSPYAHLASANEYFTTAGTRGISSLIYTDIPWMSAWRTMSPSVWVPRSDDDVHSLEAKGLRMQVVILTPQCEEYSPDETWWIIHRIKLWRSYIEDPEQGLQEILKLVAVQTKEVPLAKKYLQRINRHYMISSTIAGFVYKPQNPLAPDDVQVLVHPDIARQ